MNSLLKFYGVSDLGFSALSTFGHENGLVMEMSERKDDNYIGFLVAEDCGIVSFSETSSFISLEADTGMRLEVARSQFTYLSVSITDEY